MNKIDKNKSYQVLDQVRTRGCMRGQKNLVWDHVRNQVWKQVRVRVYFQVRDRVWEKLVGIKTDE